jgi:hypothetical protein
VNVALGDGNCRAGSVAFDRQPPDCMVTIPMHAVTPKLKKPQGPAGRLAATDLNQYIFLAKSRWGFADRGPWAMFLGNGLCLKYRDKGCLISANAKRIFAIGGLARSLAWA